VSTEKTPGWEFQSLAEGSPTWNIRILSCINQPGSRSRDSQKLKTELERAFVLIPRIAGAVSNMYQVLHARRRHIIYLEVIGNGPDVNLGTKRKVFLQLTKIESFVVVHTNAFSQNRAKIQPPIFLRWSPPSGNRE